MTLQDELIDDFHSKMVDVITKKCPNCGFDLVIEDLGDDDCNKIVIFCNKCEYSRRLK